MEKEKIKRFYEEEQEEIRKILFEDPNTISDAQFKRREMDLLLGPLGNED